MLKKKSASYVKAHRGPVAGKRSCVDTGEAEPAFACVCNGVVDGPAGVTFPADDAGGETCESVFDLCNPGRPEISDPATCEMLDEYQVAQDGCGVSLSCQVPLLVDGRPAETTFRADMYCEKTSEAGLSCSSGANPELVFEMTDTDFDAACDAAAARFV